jgi:hypothetical protein
MTPSPVLPSVDDFHIAEGKIADREIVNFHIAEFHILEWNTNTLFLNLP